MKVTAEIFVDPEAIKEMLLVVIACATVLTGVLAPLFLWWMKN